MPNTPGKFKRLTVYGSGAGRQQSQAPMPSGQGRKTGVGLQELERVKLEGDPLFLHGALGKNAEPPGADPVAGSDEVPVSDGDRLIFRRKGSGTTEKAAIGVEADGTMYFQANKGAAGSGGSGGFSWWVGGTASNSVRQRMRMDQNGSLAVATSDEPHTRLHVNGPIATNVETVSAGGTITVSDTSSVIIADAAGGTCTADLPTAVGITGRRYSFKRINSGANTLIVDGFSTQTIDGATTKTLSSQYAAMEIVSDGANWVIISSMGTIT